jgi:filamentous hemagglutinin
MFVDQTKMYKKTVDLDGKTQWVELSEQEKKNLQPNSEGKVHIFNNGIFNPLENAQNLAAQNNDADYLVYFPPANNFFSELLIAGYQKYLESGTLGLTNATQTNVQIMSQFGQAGLQVDGHSRGGMTTGNALEAVASQSNAQGSLSGTDISLFGSAYNAQQAENFLNTLSGGKGSVESQVHIDDFVGTVIGGNSPTGGTTPEGSNLVKEWVKIFYGKETAHNCYGNAPQGCGVYWGGNVSQPRVVVPNSPDLGGVK